VIGMDDEGQRPPRRSDPRNAELRPPAGGCRPSSSAAALTVAEQSSRADAVTGVGVEEPRLGPARDGRRRPASIVVRASRRPWALLGVQSAFASQMPTDNRPVRAPAERLSDPGGLAVSDPEDQRRRRGGPREPSCCRYRTTERALRSPPMAWLRLGGPSSAGPRPPTIAFDEPPGGRPLAQGATVVLSKAPPTPRWPLLHRQAVRKCPTCWPALRLPTMTSRAVAARGRLPLHRSSDVAEVLGNRSIRTGQQAHDALALVRECALPPLFRWTRRKSIDARLTALRRASANVHAHRIHLDWEAPNEFSD
jgi:hypothetical protein